MVKILIVIADRLTRLEIEKMLTGLGFEVAGLAETGTQSIALAQNLKPDLILMDAMMPGKPDGIEAAMKIQAEWNIPVIFICGYGDQEIIKKTKKIARFGYLMKPFDLTEVKSLVEIALYKIKVEGKFERVNRRLYDMNLSLQQEIEKRKRAEEAFQQSHEVLSFSQRMAGLGSWELDLSTQIITLSEEHQFMAGKAPVKIALPLAEYAADYVVEKDIPIIEDRLAVAIQNIENTRYHDSFEYRLKTDDVGGYKNLAVYGRFTSKGIITGITRDVTERKLAENTLKREAEFRRVIGAIANDFICAPLTEIDKSIQRALAAIGEFVGADRSYVIRFDYQWGTISNTYEWCREGITPRRDNLQNVPIEMFAWIIEKLSDLQVVQIPRVADLPPEAGAAKIEFEADGIQSLLLVPLVSEGRCLGTVGFAFETEPGSWLETETRILQMSGATISNALERKRSEEALQKSEEKYRLLIENATEGIYIAQDGKLKFANPNIQKMTGYSAKELEKRPFLDLIHPEDRNMVLERHLNRLKGKEEPNVYSFRIVDRSGKTISVELNTVLISWEERPATLNFLRDITSQKKLEAQLQQAQKMEAIGTLAGGVAHEFNNALMGIMGNIELLKMDLSENQRRHRYFKTMNDAGHRMSRLTDQLLAYARGGKYRTENLKLDAFLTQTLQILQHDLKPTIKVETVFPKDIPYIKADPTQMQMVLSAILANANEAIEDEGMIRITAEKKDINGEFKKQNHYLQLGSYVCLTIADDGKGMDKETKDRIFEPFFTTNFQGRGMGMAAVYGIVKNHGGRIFVESELDKGTVVQIYLPAEVVQITEDRRPKTRFFKGRGTILLIEDEDVIIEVVQAMLEMLNYQVVVARTGKEAIHITETFEGKIDLALLDIKLPDMEGGEIYPPIMKARPNLKVIVSSGFAIEGPAQNILDAGARGFLQKPFSFATLAEKLEEVLEGR